MVDNDPLTSVNLGKRIIVYHARHLEYQKKPISHNYSMDILYLSVILGGLEFKPRASS